MKGFRHQSVNIIISFLVLFLATSCEAWKDDPDYIGTWQYNETITANDMVYNTTRTIVFTKKTYEETYLIKRENSSTITAIIGTSGSIARSRSNLVFELKELGTCVPDNMEVCTEEVQWFGEGSFYWNDNIDYFEKKVTGVFEVDGTTLRLSRDLNNDKDFEDTGEDVIFELI